MHKRMRLFVMTTALMMAAASGTGCGDDAADHTPAGSDVGPEDAGADLPVRRDTGRLFKFNTGAPFARRAGSF